MSLNFLLTQALYVIISPGCLYICILIYTLSSSVYTKTDPAGLLTSHSAGCQYLWVTHAFLWYTCCRLIVTCVESNNYHILEHHKLVKIDLSLQPLSRGKGPCIFHFQCRRLAKPLQALAVTSTALGSKQMFSHCRNGDATLRHLPSLQVPQGGWGLQPSSLSFLPLLPWKGED